MLPKGGAKRIIPLEGRTLGERGNSRRLVCSADKVGRLPDNRCLTIKTTGESVLIGHSERGVGYSNGHRVSGASNLTLGK